MATLLELSVVIGVTVVIIPFIDASPATNNLPPKLASLVKYNLPLSDESPTIVNCLAAYKFPFNEVSPPINKRKFEDKSPLFLIPFAPLTIAEEFTVDALQVAVLNVLATFKTVVLIPDPPATYKFPFTDKSVPTSKREFNDASPVINKRPFKDISCAIINW